MKRAIFLLVFLGCVIKGFGEHFLPLFCCSHDLFYVSVEGGYQKFYLPDYRYGFIGELFGPPASDAFTAHDNPSSGYVSPSIGYRIPLECCSCWIPNDICLAATGNFFSSRAKSSRAFIVNDDNLIIEFPFGPTAPLPQASFDGTIIDTLSRKFKYYNGRIDLSTRYLFCVCSYPIEIEPILFSYVRSYLRQSYDLDVLIVDIEGTISIDQRLITHYDDFGAGIALRFPLWKSITLSTIHAFYASHADSTLKSSFESNQFATMRFTDEKNNVSFSYKTSLAIAYNLCHIHFGVKANYEYRGYVPGILNPQTLVIIPAIPLNFPLIENHTFSNFSVGGYLGFNF